MKTVVAFCAVSLAVNVVLAGYVMVKRREAQGGLGAGNGGGAALRTAPAGISEVTRRLLAETGTGDLAQLRDRLRAEGLPEAAVKDMVEQRLWRDGEARLDAADPRKKRPWWQQTLEPLAGDDVRMGRLREQLQAEYRARARELFPEERNEAVDAASRFLPAGKRKAVRKIRDDYDAMKSRLDQESGGVYLASSDWKKIQYLTEEEQRDLKAVLAPQEYEELELRDATEQSSLKKTAAFMNLSESEFQGLVAIDRWYDQEAKTTGGGDPFAPATDEKTPGAYDRLQAELRQRRLDLLGPDGLKRYLQVDGPDYETIARYAARFDQPPAVIDSYYALKDQLKGEMEALRDDATLTPEQRTQALDAVARKSEASLTGLLGEPVLETNLELSQLIAGFKKAPAKQDAGGK